MRSRQSIRAGILAGILAAIPLAILMGPHARGANAPEDSNP